MRDTGDNLWSQGSSCVGSNSQSLEDMNPRMRVRRLSCNSYHDESAHKTVDIDRASPVDEVTTLTRIVVGTKM